MKLNVPFLQLPLQFDADALAAEVLAIEESWWRPHPNGLPGNSALTLITTGGDAESDAVYGAMRPTSHLERCPALQQALAAIGATWGRTRLMRLSGQAEVELHVDVNYYWVDRVRIHVPIVTQPTVRFTCGEAEINMAAGECWIFDTWRPHRVVNDDQRSRIHLVADTVGGEGFWKHLSGSRPAGMVLADWQAAEIAPAVGVRPELDYESVNAPVVMTPWEMRQHLMILLAEVGPDPQLAGTRHVLMRLCHLWHGLWSCHGEDEAGWPRYQRLLERSAEDLRVQASGIVLQNGIPLVEAVFAGVMAVALPGRRY